MKQSLNLGVGRAKTDYGSEMNRIIEYAELKTMSNEELLELTKDRGVFLKLFDGTMKEVRIKDLVGADIYKAKFIDYVGLSFYRQTIKSIEIINDCPKITL